MAANTAKSLATEQRVNGLVTQVGATNTTVAAVQTTVATATSQRGSTSAAQNLSSTETGTAQPLPGSVDSGIPNNNTTSDQTGGAASHTHGMQNHTHNYQHEHYTQIQSDFDNLVAVVNQIRQALINAGIL